MNGASSSSGGHDDSKEKAKRGYRACLHCRSRKAKCDLGDIDAPSKPPCSRCRRESRECVFAPSRRGGTTKRKRESTLEVYPHPSGSSSASANVAGSSSGGYPPPSSSQMYPPHVDVLNPSPKPGDYNLFNHPSASSAEMSPSTGPSGPSPASASANNAPLPPLHHHNNLHQHEKRRRLHLNPLIPPHKSDPSSIVVADVQNESDALHILALASAGQPSNAGDSRGPRAREQRRENGEDEPQGRAVTIDEFALLRLGIVNEEQVITLINAFFRFHHHLFPMVPVDRIPRTPEQIANFAHSERYLVTAMIIIASRNHHTVAMRDVHERSWGVMRGWISDIQCLGAPPTVGLVEALLLLAENLPRDPARDTAVEADAVHAMGVGEQVHGAENNQAWMLIGTAIRCAYSLGIDKLALKLIPEVDRTYDVERARLAWTYCYLFDRHVSLRLGRAFWSRGPALCFQGFSASAQTGPAAAPRNFPFLRAAKAPKGAPPGYPEQEDLASLVQTYLELTQLMSNAHDVLYPNAARTRSLVLYGEYFKYIDELARSLDGFKVLWREKKWKLFPLTDAMWAMVYYTQLYICAFSFQAHVERAALRAEEEYRENSTAPRPSISLFPRGAAASPDARYIFQSIDAARQLLTICVDSLHPGGALPYLPNRFLLWFTYAAIVLLKAMYSGAMLRADHEGVHKLIDRLCECFAEASPDADHPAVRYGLQLQALRAKLSGIGTSANSPTGGHTVPLPPTSAAEEGQEWAGQEDGSSTRDRRDPRDTREPTDMWSFPAVPVPSSASMPFPFATPGSTNVAPPHEQPLSEINSLQISVDNNLGFATLEDWFPVPSASTSAGGGAAGSTASNVGAAASGIGPAGNPFEALDLADFWMKVGPGEAQGGFPFR